MSTIANVQRLDRLKDLREKVQVNCQPADDRLGATWKHAIDMMMHIIENGPADTGIKDALSHFKLQREANKANDPQNREIGHDFCEALELCIAGIVDWAKVYKICEYEDFVDLEEEIEEIEDTAPNSLVEDIIDLTDAEEISENEETGGVEKCKEREDDKDLISQASDADKLEKRGNVHVNRKRCPDAATSDEYQTPVKRCISIPEPLEEDESVEFDTQPTDSIENPREINVQASLVNDNPHDELKPIEDATHPPLPAASLQSLLAAALTPNELQRLQALQHQPAAHTTMSIMPQAQPIAAANGHQHPHNSSKPTDNSAVRPGLQLKRQHARTKFNLTNQATFKRRDQMPNQVKARADWSTRDARKQALLDTNKSAEWANARRDTETRNHNQAAQLASVTPAVHNVFMSPVTYPSVNWPSFK